MLKNIVILLVISIVCINCAQYAAPTGGKKDETPPKLLASKPASKTLNYKSRTIELVFDELIETTNLQQDLIVTPKPEGLMTVKNKGKAVELKFDKDFRPNTTYTFNFRNGVRDLSEKNPATNLKYIFSTGDKIDSLTYEGTVKYLLTGKPANEITIGLYAFKDTFDLKKSKPYYFIKTDTSGIYKLENLKDGQYKVLAFNDKNNNLMYDDKNEEIGFRKDTLNLIKNISNETYKVAIFDKKPPKVLKNNTKSEDHTIQFDETLKEVEVKFLSTKDSLPYSYSGTQIQFYNSRKNSTDSNFVNIKAIDSTGNVLELKTKFKFREAEKKKKESFVEMNIQPSTGNDIDLPIEYSILFDKPIQLIDTSKMTIQVDSSKREVVNSKEIKWNENHTALTFNKAGKRGKMISFILEKGAFINVLGDSSSKFMLRNPVLELENYGMLKGKILNPKKVDYIIQLMDETEKIRKETMSTEKFSFEKIKEGTYFVRVIIDTDKNKKWSKGDVEKMQEAESVFFSPKIRIKANFEINDFNIELK